MRTWTPSWPATPWAIGIIAFSGLIIMKGSTLLDPPYWDAAMAVHPAAKTLAATNFDYPALLRTEGFLDGGPNTHAISSYTWLAAIVYALLPHQAALPVLHVASLFLGAAVASGATAVAKRFVPDWIAACTGLTIVAVPLVVTQLGLIYLEVPLMAATIWSINAVLARRPALASLLALLATSAKVVGIIIAIALATSFWVDWRERHAAALVALPSVALAAIIASLQAPSETFGWDVAAATGQASIAAIRFVPDIGMLIIAATVGGLWLRRQNPRGSRALGTVWLVSLTGFILLNALLWFGVFVTLPRYFTFLLPIAFVVVIVSVVHATSMRAAVILIGVSLVWSILNYHGELYPAYPARHPALAERSNEYRFRLEADVGAVRGLCSLGLRGPVYASGPLYFGSAFDLGYGECAETTNMRFGAHASLTEGTTIVIATGGDGFGERNLERVIAAAEAETAWTVTSMPIPGATPAAYSITMIRPSTDR